MEDRILVAETLFARAQGAKVLCGLWHNVVVELECIPRHVIHGKGEARSLLTWKVIRPRGLSSTFTSLKKRRRLIDAKRERGERALQVAFRSWGVLFRRAAAEDAERSLSDERRRKAGQTLCLIRCENCSKKRAWDHSEQTTFLFLFRKKIYKYNGSTKIYSLSFVKSCERRIIKET